MVRKLQGLFKTCWGCRTCDCMVVGFTTTCAISAHHCLNCEFEPCSWRGILNTTLCDKLTTGQWFSPVSSTNKIDCHDITEILLKLASNTIKQPNQPSNMLKILKMNMTEGIHFFIVSGEQIYFTLLSTIHLDIEGRHF